jgi:predicted AAA+ superfamily ATPase
VPKIHFGNTVAKCVDLWERTKQTETWKEIRYRKWKWTRHILRQDNESIAKKALKWNPQRGRRKGRLRITWQSTVTTEGEHQSNNWPEIKSE